MARYTLDEAEAFYTASKEAYLSALSNKSYGVSGRSKENQDIEKLKLEMDKWADIRDKLSRGRSTGPTVKRAFPRV